MHNTTKEATAQKFTTIHNSDLNVTFSGLIKGSLGQVGCSVPNVTANRDRLKT